MTETPNSRAGTSFGPYELISLVGRGGMGEVYRARDTRKGRVVAIKLLPRAFSDDPRFRQRFEREAHVAAGLNDPHVVPIHDYGEIDGVLYIDMAFADGSDLRSLLRERGPLPPHMAVDLIDAVASALDASHAQGLLHRDVKPENIMVTDKGFVYLTDFGIAAQQDDTRLTTKGGAIGSLAYMAPERFDDGEVTGAVDQYALGCVLFECLKGRPPFEGASTTSMMKAQLFTEPPQLEPSQNMTPMDQVIHRAMAKDPTLRFASVGAMSAAARAALQGQVDPETSRLAGSGTPTTAGPAASPMAHATTMQSPGGGGTTQPGQPAQFGGPAYTPTGGSKPEKKSSSGGLWKVAIAAVVVAALAIGGLVLKNLMSDDNTQQAGGNAGNASVAASEPSQAASTQEPTQSEPAAAAPSESSAAATTSSSPSATTPAPTASAITQKTALTSLDGQPSNPRTANDETIAGKSYSSIIKYGACNYSDEGQQTRWALDGKYTNLTVFAGMLDSSYTTSLRGSVEIYVDGKLVAQTGEMAVGSPAKKLDVPLTGANLLTFKVPEPSDCDSADIGLGDATLTGADS
ncbi:protein kinase domain-containing protein [Dermacoccaceae bacterium W4C1]